MCSYLRSETKVGQDYLGFDISTSPPKFSFSPKYSGGQLISLGL